MKKIIFIICLTTAFALSAAYAASVLDAQFGTTKEMIETQYHAKGLSPSFEDHNSLGYTRTLVPFSDAARVLYEFYNNQLWAVKVNLNVSAIHSINFSLPDSAQGLIDKYNFYKGTLTQQYGVQPMIDEFMAEDFDNDEFRLSGLKNGKGHYKSEWETYDMRILLALAGVNDQVDFEIYYIYKPIFREKEQAEADWKMKWF